MLTSEQREAAKLCVDCEYVITNRDHDGSKYHCGAPQNVSGVSLVTGDNIYFTNTCELVRTGDVHCGKAGLWFKKKEEYYIQEQGKPETRVRLPKQQITTDMI